MLQVFRPPGNSRYSRYSRYSCCGFVTRNMINILIINRYKRLWIANPQRLMLELAVVMAVAFLGIGAVSCGGSGSTVFLDRAESVMEEYPDSALGILRTVDRDRLRGGEEKAKYSLLMTQAMVKNGFLIYSDSLLRPAIEYYSPKGDSPELMKTLFYQGEIEMNRFDSLTNQPGLRTDGSPYGFLSKSTVCATRAYEMSREFDDDLWRAKSAEMLADAYSRSIQFKQSLEYTEEAAEYYRKSGKIRNHRFSLCDLGYRSFLTGDTLRAISVLDSVSNVARQPAVDSALLRYCYRDLYGVYVNAKLFDEASRIREELRAMQYPEDQTMFEFVAELCLKQGRPVEAMEMARKAYPSAKSLYDRQVVYRIYAIANSMLGEHEKASLYMDTIIMLQYNDFNNAIEESASSAQRDYFNKAAVERQEKIDATRRIIIISTAVVLLIFAVIVYCFRRNARRRKEEMDRMMANLLIKTEQLEDIDRKVVELKDENEQLRHLDEENENMRQTLGSAWASINTLCRQYFLNGERNKDTKEIVDRMDKKMKGLRSAKSMEDIERMANQLHKGIVTALREKCPDLSRDDMNLAVLVYAGFDAAAVCMILGIENTKTFHNRKFRLREKILASGISKEDPLIAILF